MSKYEQNNAPPSFSVTDIYVQMKQNNYSELCKINIIENMIILNFYYISND